MTGVVLLVCLLLCMIASGVFSGGETGLYSLWPARVEAEAARGSRSARLIRRLLRDDVGLLVTILIGNNLANQLAALIGSDLVRRSGVPDHLLELAGTLALTPFLFFFSELLPKNLFLRRPHVLVGYSAPLIAIAKGMFLPLAVPLRLLATGLARLLGLGGHELARAVGREAVVDMIAETSATTEAHVEELAQNVLGLRSLRLDRVMIPWRRVASLRAGDPEPELYRAVERCRFSRLPWFDETGAITGYVHQLDVLGGGPGTRTGDHLRPIQALPPSMPLDRALVRLRAAGERLAVVGTPSRPIGLVSLKDLVEEICGELARW